MKFIQAAPDELYFTWQYKVQAANFREFDLEKDMTIVVGLKPGSQPSQHIKEFEKTFAGKIHYYEDTRKSKHYLSSIRPNIIKQYLKDYPTDVFCYIDQDIIWLEDPKLDRFANDPNQYTAEEAKGYTWAKYMKVFNDGKIFQGLCKIIDIDPEFVEANDDGAGAAQFIIKGTDADWWDEYERQLEEAFIFVGSEIQRDRDEHNDQKRYNFQHWSVDCNVLWMKLLTTGKPVLNLQEINFCWPYDTFEGAKEKGRIMMHNSGIAETNRNHWDVRKNEKGEDEMYDTGRPKWFDKQLFKDDTPFNYDFSFVDPKSLQAHYISYFKQFATQPVMKTEPKRKLLVLWNSSYGRAGRKIHPGLLKSSLESLKKAAENTTKVEVKVVTTAWEQIPDNPFPQIISPFRDMGHLNYLLQMKQQIVLNPGYDFVTIIEHDCITPENYFNEVVENWNYGKYGLNNRNYIGINKTGYLNVTERHHPMSMMSFAYFWFAELLNKKIDECILNIAPGAPFGWTCVEPDDKGLMHEFWGSKPNIHVSTAGLPNDLHHNFSTHDLVCYEHDSKGKLEREDWGHYLEVVPFLKEFV